MVEAINWFQYWEKHGFLQWVRKRSFNLIKNTVYKKTMEELRNRVKVKCNYFQRISKTVVI